METKTTPPTDGQPIRLITLSEVIRLTAIGRSNIYAGMRAGTFPKSCHAGARALWVEREISAWNAARIAERDAKAVAA